MTVVAAAAISLGTSELMAQSNGNSSKGGNSDSKGGSNNGSDSGRRGRGGFDPARMQQMMMDNLKEQLDITDDAEWKAIQPMIQKVMDLRRESASGMGRMFGRGRGGDRGGDSNSGDSNRSSRGGGFFGAPSPEAEALQKAVDSKASNAEMKAAIAKYQESRKAKQAELEKAQAELRKVLTLKQEAVAMLDGLL